MIKKLTQHKQLPIIIFGLVIITLSGYFVSSAQASFPPGGSSAFLCHVLNLNCVPPAPPVITNMSKSSTPPELLGTQRTATIRISFTVPATAVGLSGVEVEEVLNSPFSFLDPINATLTKGGVNQPFGAPPEINPSRQGARFIIGNLTPGNYLLRFDVEVPSGVADGTYVVERDSGNCTNSFNNYAGTAQIYFRNSANEPGCNKLPNTSVFRRAAKVVFNSDAWIGNKPLQAGNTIQIGPNSLIISGKGASQGISNYNLPTTGKNSWDSIESLMRQRVERAITARSAEIVQSNRCPSGDVRTLYLNAAGNSPFVDGPRITKPKIWILNNCSFTLRDATFFGTGTIVNVTIGSSGQIAYNGGILNIFGGLRPNNLTDTFGYVTFRENAGSSGVGHINLQGDADPDNVALFTSGVVDMGGNPTSSVITRQMQVMSRFIQFPPQNQMNNDIIFEKPAQLLRNVPPLFQQFSQPTGQEVP